MRKYCFWFLLVFAMFVFSNSLYAAYYHYQISADPGDISGQSLSASNTESHYHTVTVEAQAWTIGNAGATASAGDTDWTYPAPTVSVYSHNGGTYQDSATGWVDDYIAIWLDVWAGNGMSSAHVNITW
ncbi:MAG: hypothetical protein PVH88_17120 [Ignavibacteria bacterium]|jgi:hypothetical protein